MRHYFLSARSFFEVPEAETGVVAGGDEFAGADAAGRRGRVGGSWGVGERGEGEGGDGGGVG